MCVTFLDHLIKILLHMLKHEIQNIIFAYDFFQFDYVGMWKFLQGLKWPQKCHSIKNWRNIKEQRKSKMKWYFVSFWENANVDLDKSWLTCNLQWESNGKVSGDKMKRYCWLTLTSLKLIASSHE